MNIFNNNLVIHRALIDSGVTENTLPAIAKCVDNNYPLEIDIHILKDKTIVVYHDFYLKRLCKVNRIIDNCTYAQLLKYKINDKYIIPTLKQVIHIVDGKVPILLDIKNLTNNEIFGKKLIKLLINYKGIVGIQSINPYVIKWFKKNSNKFFLGIIILNKINYKIIRKCIKKVNFISINKKELPLKKNYKKCILGWTIKNKEDFLKYQNSCDILICEKIV